MVPDKAVEMGTALQAGHVLDLDLDLTPLLVLHRDLDLVYSNIQQDHQL